MKRPVEPTAKICLGDFTRQLDQLGIREMFPQFGKQLIADFSGSVRHGNGKIKDELLYGPEYTAFLIVRKTPQFLFRDAGCPALGRA